MAGARVPSPASLLVVRDRGAMEPSLFGVAPEGSDQAKSRRDLDTMYSIRLSGLQTHWKVQPKIIWDPIIWEPN